MSGFEFEHFFGHLLKRLERGRVDEVESSREEGRQILVRTATGLMVVECKHNPNGSIGRPVVEKLHSTIVSLSAEGGILVTTGRFTKEALAYAQEISPQVEMIDRALLTEMATRAGITMISRGDMLSLWTLEVPAEDATITNLGKDLDRVLEGHPRSPSALLSHTHRSIEYRPIYLVIYHVNAVFETSVGVIHQEQASQATIALDGMSGELLEEDMKDFVTNERQTQLQSANNDLVKQIPKFQLDAVSARTKAKQLIMKLHTKTKYYDTKVRTYLKDLVPRERDIFIADIRQLYVPSFQLEFNLLSIDYKASFFHGPSGKMLYRGDDLKVCRVCNNSIGGQAILCDTCGRTTHGERLLTSRNHGFHCKVCKRTTCRFDGKWVHRWLVFKKPLCPACALDAEREGSKTYTMKVLGG